ncbi:MAG: hypothetical protein ACYDBB_11285 [Armatimonadota bacterium]
MEQQTRNPASHTSGRRRIWLLLLALLVLGVGGWQWWRWAHSLHLVGQYRVAQSTFPYQTYLPDGFLLLEPGSTAKQHLLIFRDWSGKERWRNTVADPEPNAQYTLSPNGHWFLIMSPIGDGLLADFTLWHDGRVVRKARLPACPSYEMRDDGTAWLVGCTGQLLHVYAMRQEGIKAGQDRLPMALSSNCGWDYKLALSVEIPRTDQVAPPFLTGCSLSADASTLQIDAYKNLNISQTIVYPSYLTYRLYPDGNHIRMKRKVDATKKYVDTYSKPMGQASVPKTPVFYRVITSSGAEWHIPKGKQPGNSWITQTNDGRFALVSRVSKESDAYPLLKEFRQKLGGWLRSDSIQSTDRAQLILSLYEQPGTLRASTSLPLETADSGGPAVYLSPDGRTQLVVAGTSACLFSR